MRRLLTLAGVAIALLLAGGITVASIPDSSSVISSPITADAWVVCATVAA